MEHRVCPWWLGYLLLNPLRLLVHNPDKILKLYLKERMTVLDIGSGMGFFSLPAARIVGDSGKVICVDLQEKMIASLRKRAEKAGLSAIIKTRLCSKESLAIDDLEGQIDFCLAFALAHEVPDKQRLFTEIHKSLKSGGKLFLAEPRGHVPKTEFDNTVSIAQASHFKAASYPEIARTHAVLLQKE